MKPLNAAKRNSTFLNFLVFFVVTMMLIITTVFFGMQVPFKQNEAMQQQLTRLQNEKAFAENFSANMMDTKILLDTVNRAEVQSDLVDGEITQRLQHLKAMIDTDSVGDKKIYQDIVGYLYEIQSNKKALRVSGTKDQMVSQYLQQIQDLTNQLNASKMEAYTLRTQLLSLSH